MAALDKKFADEVVKQGNEALDAYCVNLNEKAVCGGDSPPGRHRSSHPPAPIARHKKLKAKSGRPASSP